MKKKIIVCSIIFLSLVVISLWCCVHYAENNKEISEKDTNNLIKEKEDLELPENIEENETDDNIEPSKQIDSNNIDEKVNTKDNNNSIIEDKKISSSSNNKEEQANTKVISKTEEKNNNNNIPKEQEIWEKLGMTKEQYYNKPMYSWERIDYASMESCLNYGDNYEPYLEGKELYNCRDVLSPSGKWLGVMFETIKIE